MKRLVYTPKINAYIKADSGIYDLTEYITEFQIDRKINQVSTAELKIRNPYMKWTNHSYRDSVTGEHKIGPIFHPMDPITIILTRLRNHPVQVFTGFCDTTPYLQLYPGVVPITASCTLKKLQYTFFDAGLPFTREWLSAHGWLPNEDGSLVKPGAEVEGNGKHPREENEGVRFGDSGIGELLFAVLNEIGGWPENTIHIQNMPASVITLVGNLFELFKKEDEAASKELEELLTKIVGTASVSETEGTASREEVFGKPTVMYDSTTIGEIPKDAAAVAGYVDGAYANFSDMVKQFPNARRLSIAVFASSDADCLDIEPGNATPSEAPAWVKRQISRLGTTKKPTVYAAVSEMNSVISALNAAGISQNSYKIWTAHVGNGKHVCGPGTCGATSGYAAHGTQWNWEALGRNLDESVLNGNFWEGTSTAQGELHR